jgi:hypothetical protein
MGSGRDRPYFSGKHKCHGVNVQVIADPAGRLIWASPALPGARHDMGAAREHGIIDALREAEVIDTPQRRRPADPETGQRRRLSRNQREVNSAMPVSAARASEPTPSSRPGGSFARPLLSAPSQHPGPGDPGPHPRQLTPSGKRSVIAVAVSTCADSLGRSHVPDDMAHRLNGATSGLIAKGVRGGRPPTGGKWWTG